MPRDNAVRAESLIGMRPSLPVPRKTVWFRHVGKGVAVAASTGAALISIISALYSHGMIGNPEAHQSIGNIGAAWVRLRPTADTANALGDTILFAATIADRNGSVLIGARPTWTTGDASVATVESDGAVVARGPGATTVSVVVGALVATSRVVVKQRVAGVVVSSAAGDTAVTVLEGAQLQLRARALDARGHGIVQSGAAWHIDDTSVAALDPRGMLIGRNAGRSVVSAKIEGASGYLPVSVATTATALAIVAGDRQRARAGRPLPRSIVLRATNRRGAAASGKAVTFRLADGQGKVDPPSTMTDADGRARAAWTLGDFPGPQTLFATVENVDSAMAIVAEAEPSPGNTRVTSLLERLHARVGATLTDSVGVRVTDSTGRALAEVPVQWNALDGSSALAMSARTDSLGVARVRWTLAGRVGTQRIRAQLARGIPPVTIGATVMAGAAAAIAVVDGTRQRARVGTALAKPLVIRAVDANGNGVAGTALVLSLSGGSVRDSTPVTDSLGRARITWTMGRFAGEHTLAVHVDGVKQLLKVTAHASHAAAANLAFEDAPAEKGARTNARRLRAVVTDVYGNPVPDASVSFSSKSGIVTPARAVTDAKGRVAIRWLPGGKGSEQTLRGIVRATDVKGAYILTVPAKKPGGR